jgi:hypothetical protein
LNAPGLVEKMKTKGIHKFIAFEVPDNLVREKYGNYYNVVMGDLHQDDDLRVLDYDGHHVFHNFQLANLGPMICHDE